MGCYIISVREKGGGVIECRICTDSVSNSKLSKPISRSSTTTFSDHQLGAAFRNFWT